MVGLLDRVAKEVDRFERPFAVLAGKVVENNAAVSTDAFNAEGASSRERPGIISALNVTAISGRAQTLPAARVSFSFFLLLKIAIGGRGFGAFLVFSLS